MKQIVGFSSDGLRLHAANLFLARMLARLTPLTRFALALRYRRVIQEESAEALFPAKINALKSTLTGMSLCVRHARGGDALTPAQNFTCVCELQLKWTLSLVFFPLSKSFVSFSHGAFERRGLGCQFVTPHVGNGPFKMINSDSLSCFHTCC